MRWFATAVCSVCAAIAPTRGGWHSPHVPGRCMAATTSLTPPGWSAPQAQEPSAPSRLPAQAPLLNQVVDVPLPGGASRFDYQSLDAGAQRLYVAHMGAGRLVVFDIRGQRVIASLEGFPGATGVLAVPELQRVYLSVTGRHEVAVVSQQTLRLRARVAGIQFPDGIAYAPDERRVFVSDEAGRADVAIDGPGDTTVAVIPLGGEAGNTHYDAVSHCILVAVQTRNQLVAIDPATLRIAGRYDLPGGEGPHGFVLDERRRLAYVAAEDNAKLLVFDLRTMRVTAVHSVGDRPDVLALDPGIGRLYVASEAGVVSVFAQAGDALRALGEIRAPHAHSVAADPITHRVYLPLADVGGRPVLRIMAPPK